MRVLFNATMVHGRQIVVDHMHDVFHVDASSRDTGRHENGSLAGTERPHGSFTFDLRTVTVNRSHRKMHVVEEIVEIVRFLATVHKDNGANTTHLSQA